MVDTVDCSWLGRFPNKINLDNHEVIYRNLMRMADDAVGPLNHNQVRQWIDAKTTWLYYYIDKQAPEAFLEIGLSGKWVVFRSPDAEAELALFILIHS